jgi:hypothetical protein
LAQALPANIRLGWKLLTVADTLAYYGRKKLNSRGINKTFKSAWKNGFIIKRFSLQKDKDIYIKDV